MFCFLRKLFKIDEIELCLEQKIDDLHHYLKYLEEKHNVLAQDVNKIKQEKVVNPVAPIIPTPAPIITTATLIPADLTADNNVSAPSGIINQ